MKQLISLTVNGTLHQIMVEPYRSLLDVLRDQLGLTGTKRGCERGNCGACTVLLDGHPVNACLLLAMDAQGRQLTTIEGLADDGKLQPLQDAFIRYGAVQCGYCTPGFILTAKAFLEENPYPTEAEAREALAGNLCRCTGYVKIIEAVMAVVRGE